MKYSAVKSERTVFKCIKRKRKVLCCVHLLHKALLTCKIRTFHVAVVQRRLRNVQKIAMHLQSCCFAYINLLLFAVLVVVALVIA